MMDVKKLIECLCCNYTYGALVDLCDFYYRGIKKDPAKAKRHDLEQLAFIILSLNIDPAGIYEIYTDEKVILDCALAPKAVNYIFKNTLYFWVDEPEYPTTKDSLQQRVHVRQIATRTF